MSEFNNIYKLDNYRQGTRATAPDKVDILLKNGGFGNNFVFNQDREPYKPKAPEVHDIWVTAGVSLRYAHNTRSPMHNLISRAFAHGCYLLIVTMTGVKAGKRVDDAHCYELENSIKVKAQINWERARACGNGEFFFQNYTGELNQLFIELEWVSAK